MTEQNADVIGLPLPEVERYLTRAEMAKLMGISLATLDNMVIEGMPHERWGKRLVRFRASTAIQWARTRREAS